jgi:hypothetical protein
MGHRQSKLQAILALFIVLKCTTIETVPECKIDRAIVLEVTPLITSFLLPGSLRQYMQVKHGFVNRSPLLRLTVQRTVAALKNFQDHSTVKIEPSDVDLLETIAARRGLGLIDMLEQLMTEARTACVRPWPAANKTVQDLLPILTQILILIDYSARIVTLLNELMTKITDRSNYPAFIVQEQFSEHNKVFVSLAQKLNLYQMTPIQKLQEVVDIIFYQEGNGYRLKIMSLDYSLCYRVEKEQFLVIKAPNETNILVISDGAASSDPKVAPINQKPPIQALDACLRAVIREFPSAWFEVEHQHTDNRDSGSATGSSITLLEPAER